MYQIHKYDPSMLKPLAKLAEEPTYGRALMRMEKLKQELPSFCELCIVDSDLAVGGDDGVLWRTVPCLFVVLEAWGNPDLGEPPGRLLPRKTVAARDLAHASELCLAFISRNGLGGGNWIDKAGDISDAKGHPVGHVSYNGKVWEPGSWRPGMTPLWPPPRLAPAFPAPVASASEAPSSPPTFKVGDKVTEHLRQGDPTPYTVKAVSPSGQVLTLVADRGSASIVRAHRDSTGKYRVKDGGFLRHAGVTS